MPVMRRRIFTFSSVISLLLCLATVALWVRSYWFVDFVAWRSSSLQSGDVVYRHWVLSSCEGGACLYGERGIVESTFPQSSRQWHRWPVERGTHAVGEYERATRYFDMPTSAHPLGFQVAARSTAGRWPRSFFTIALPFWFLSMLLGALPALSLASKLRQSRRIRRGLCRSCGYDLRRSADRCPECGTPVGTAKIPQA
jgi:hypothetical protein